MNEIKSNSQQENLNLFNRERLEAVGILEIVSSGEKEIIAKLENSYMQILGENLTVLKLIPENKILGVSGKIKGINYLEKHTKKSLLRKVFK